MPLFSPSRPNGVAAKRSVKRSLSGLGLFACVAAVSLSGCGGGSNNHDGNGSASNPIITPVVSSNLPRLVVQGVRDQIVIIASENVSPDGNLNIIPDNPKQLKVSATEGVTVNYPTSYTLLAPRIWADRKFKDWELNGTVISTDTVLPIVSIPTSLNGTLKAVYIPYVLPAAEKFVPNYLADLVILEPWSYMPLNVWVDPLLTPDAGSKQLFFDGLNKWVRASGGVINYTLVANAGEADVRFRSTSALTNLPGQVLGITIPFQLADNLNAASKFTDIYLVRAQYGAQNATDRLDYSATVAHEFGHALGMIGHSKNPIDLMYPYNGPLEVTQNDINSVATLYRQFFNGGTTIPTRSVGHFGPNTRTKIK